MSAILSQHHRKYPFAPLLVCRHGLPIRSFGRKTLLHFNKSLTLKLSLVYPILVIKKNLPPEISLMTAQKENTRRTSFTKTTLHQENIAYGLEPWH
jgi:hypothetical protein